MGGGGTDYCGYILLIESHYRQIVLLCFPGQHRDIIGHKETHSYVIESYAFVVFL